MIESEKIVDMISNPNGDLGQPVNRLSGREWVEELFNIIRFYFQVGTESSEISRSYLSSTALNSVN